MITKTINSVIHFSHDPWEVAELERATIPMAEHIRVVASSHERRMLRHILACDDFRRHDAYLVKSMLLKAAKHARATLGDYFLPMHEGIMGEIEELEQAANRYWNRFEIKRQTLVSTY